MQMEKKEIPKQKLILIDWNDRNWWIDEIDTLHDKNGGDKNPWARYKILAVMGI